MKVTLKNLSKSMMSVKGSPIMVIMEEGKEPEPLKVKDVLMNLCGRGYEKTRSTDVPKFYRLMLAINDAKNELQIDDEDLSLLKKAIEANIPKYEPYMLGPALILSGIEEDEKKK